MKKITKVSLALAAIGTVGFVVYKGVKAIMDEYDKMDDCYGCPHKDSVCDYDCDNCPCADCASGCECEVEFTDEECGCEECRCDDLFEENCDCHCECHNEKDTPDGEANSKNAEKPELKETV